MTRASPVAGATGEVGKRGTSAGERRDVRIPIGVSACLLGRRTRYDGRLLDARIELDPDVFHAIPVCPELAAGMRVPRPAVDLCGPAGAIVDGAGEARDEDGREVSATLLAGAHACLDELRAAGASAVVLKERSPSCGLLETPQGREPGAPAGPGVFGELATREGFEVISSTQVADPLALRAWCERVARRARDERVRPVDAGSAGGEGS